MPWLVWLNGLSASLRTKTLPVRFPVRAHVWCVGQAPVWWPARGNSLMYLSHVDVSLPPFSSLKINKILKRFLFIFREREREGGRQGEKHQCMVASHMPPTGDLARNPGMCPRLGNEPGTLWFAGWHSIQ